MLLRCHLFSSYDALNGVPTHAYRDNARFASDLTLRLSRPSKVHSPKLPLPRSHPPQLSEAFCLGYYSFSSVFCIGLMIVPFFHFVKPFFSKQKEPPSFGGSDSYAAAPANSCLACSSVCSHSVWAGHPVVSKVSRMHLP